MDSDTAARRVAMAFLVLFGILIVFTSINWTTPSAVQAVANKQAAAVWEYWFQRYQGLISPTVIAGSAMVAFFALRTTRRKNQADVITARLQATSSFLDQLNQLQETVAEQIDPAKFKTDLDRGGGGAFATLLEKRQSGRTKAKDEILKNRIALLQVRLEQNSYDAVADYLIAAYKACETMGNVDDFVRRQANSGVAAHAIARSVDAHLLQHRDDAILLESVEPLWTHATDVLIDASDRDRKIREELER